MPTIDRPFADSAIAKYLFKQIEALAPVKSQREIAQETGYNNPNMISMFKRGDARVPLDRIPALAKALKVDVTHLFRLGLEQYAPSLGETIAEIFGRMASENEERIFLSKWRRTTRNTDPEPDKRITAIIDRALKEIEAALDRR